MMISRAGENDMMNYILYLYTENEEGIRKKSGVIFVVGYEEIGNEIAAKNQCDKPTRSICILDKEDLKKCLENLRVMKKNEEDIIIYDKCEVINDLQTIKILKEISESQKIKIVICKHFKRKKDYIFQETGVYEGILPEIDDGVGMNFSIIYPEKVLVGKALGREFLSDSTMYIVNCTGEEIKNYYEKVIKRCYEINSVLLFTDQNGLYAVEPKSMFCFDSLASYMHFKKGYDQLTDSVEIVQWDLTYGSTSNIVNIMSVFVDLIKIENS